MSDTIDFNKLYNTKAFHMWLWSEATDQERALFETIAEYSEEYFRDFRFEPDSVAADYLTYHVQSADNSDDTGHCETLDPPEDLSCFNVLVLESFRYKVEAVPGVGGSVDLKNMIVTINPEDNKKSTILHEIIHLYEVVLDNHIKIYHDILLLSLYNSLKPQIPDIDDRIIGHSNMLSNENVASIGGDHDLLFFLKSLDLDLKCGYKPGTVCGYGRDE